MSDAIFLATFLAGLICGSILVAIWVWSSDYDDEWKK